MRNNERYDSILAHEYQSIIQRDSRDRCRSLDAGEVETNNNYDYAEEDQRNVGKLEFSHL